MKRILVLSTVVTLATFISGITMKVGLYNYIPDLANDGLKSYKQLIKSKWDAKGTGIDLDLIVDSTEYDPYGNFDEYLGDGPNSFDIIETDMAAKQALKGKALVLNLKDISKLIDIHNFINASMQAVSTGDGNFLGIPTLECGNFITQVQIKENESHVALKEKNYQEFNESLAKAKQTLVNNLPCNQSAPSSKFNRLIGGKTSDKYGWYLPFAYLDSLMDQNTELDHDQEISNIMDGIVNDKVIQKMHDFFGYFEDNCGNVGDPDVTLEKVVQRKTAYFYGFSEKLSQLIEMSEGNVQAFNILTPPFNDEKQTPKALLYTDAVVINKKKYDQGGKDVKKAIFHFIKFFTGNELRHAIVMGEDLSPKRIRYLLIPNKEFYEETTNPIYKEYYQIIQNGVSAPSLNEGQRRQMQLVLEPLVFSTKNDH